MGIDWGLSTSTPRKAKVEKFDTPVLTMSDLADGGKGKARKFMFNKAAQEALGLVVPSEDNENQSYVTLGKNSVTGEIFVMSALEESEQMKMFKVTKSFTFSDKASYEFITNRLGLSNVVENHLHLVEVEGEPYFKVDRAEPDSDPAAVEASQAEEEEGGKMYSQGKEEPAQVPAQGAENVEQSEEASEEASDEQAEAPKAEAEEAADENW